MPEEFLKNYPHMSPSERLEKLAFHLQVLSQEVLRTAEELRKEKFDDPAE